MNPSKPYPASLLFPVEGDNVLLVLNGFRVAALAWEQARLLGRALQRPADIEPPSPFSFRLEIEKVFVSHGVMLIADLPFADAARAGAILIGQAGMAEEHAKAEQIIQDQAFATRAGLPFGMSINPRILEAAKVVAFGDRGLRKALPEMRGTAMLGAPSVRQYSPDPKVAARQALAALTDTQRFALATSALKGTHVPSC